MRLGELTEMLVKALVDQEAAVKVMEVTGQQVTVIEVRVAKEDLGKIIGKKGLIIEALRTILGAAAVAVSKREGGIRRVQLELLNSS